ncbi:MAG: hypothetical protein Q7S48_02850 [bacterium]|nr:hypothetical protein [bacterium]
MPHKSWHSAAGFGLVILMGLGIFVLALTTLPERLQAPFGLTPKSSLADASFAPDSPEALFAETKDTDRDGIPDVQELQVYKTSPFLEDSDSDGFRDKEEIETGNDPNCPKGKDCRTIAFPSAREVQQQEMIAKLYDSTVTAKLGKTGVPGISDPASIRGFLRSAGVPENILVQFDDSALRRMFEEATAQQGGVNSGAQDPALQDTSGTLPGNPSPQEIRELLLRAGMDAELLKKFNDEQIVKLYQDTLKEVNTPE